MNKAFEKIIERIDKEIPGYTGKVKQIVQEAAEEYKNNDYVNEIQDMALELAVYVLEEELWKYAWLENANNETGVVVTYKDAICIIKDMLKGSETDEEDI